MVLTRPDNLKYLSVLYRLRVIIPTQWPATSLCTLHPLRYLTDATLGTRPSELGSLLDSLSRGYLGLDLAYIASPTSQRQLRLAYTTFILNQKTTEKQEIFIDRYNYRLNGEHFWPDVIRNSYRG